MHPCSVALWPMVTCEPTDSGRPGSVCKTHPSCTLLRSPTTMVSWSARSTAPYHTLASAPTVIRPMSTAPGPRTRFPRPRDGRGRARPVTARRYRRRAQAGCSQAGPAHHASRFDHVVSDQLGHPDNGAHHQHFPDSPLRPRVERAAGRTGSYAALAPGPGGRLVRILPAADDHGLPASSRCFADDGPRSCPGTRALS